MNKKVIIFSILVFIFLVPTVSLSGSKKSSTLAYLDELHSQGKERVIVKFKDQIDKKIVEKYNAKIIRELKIINSLVCEIDKDKIEILKSQSDIIYVVPDLVVRVPEPNEISKPYKPIGSLLYEGTVSPDWNNLQDGLNAKAAWDRYNLDGNDVKIAIIDTAINYQLPDLNDNYLGGINILTGEPDPLPYIDPDPYPNDHSEDHGTFVTSIAVGEGNSFVVGTAYNAKYYAVKVLDTDGVGLIDDLIEGIEWALQEPHKADIISMSFGIYDEDGGPIWPYYKAEFEAACNSAYEAGIILVAASGNRGYDHSSYPAAFNNVISVGSHKENQTLPSYCGGVDVVAPGYNVDILHPKNLLYWGNGTSLATPHASALLALQIQYARQNHIQPNNGYHWEVMKHSAHHLTGQPYDPVYQGKGKIYAAHSEVNDVNLGSIDLIASNWPIDYSFQFHDYSFIDSNYPVYQIGQDVNQTIILTNLTDILGNTVETIENLKVTATQVYYGEPNEPNLPGDSVKVFPTITTLEPNEANSITLSYVYTIPPETIPGLKKTKIEFEFNFVGNSRVIKISYNEPNSFWYAAIRADLDLDNNIDFSDYSLFAQNWGEMNCQEPDWCSRADIDRSGVVDFTDLKILSEKWLIGL